MNNSDINGDDKLFRALDFDGKLLYVSMMYANWFRIFKKLIEGRIVIHIYNAKCPFVNFINLSVNVSVMAHPYKWTI